MVQEGSFLIRQKLVENAKIKKKSKWDILGDFQTMWNGKVKSYLQNRYLKVTRGLKASRISQGSYSFFAKCVIIIPWITTRASSVILTFWSKKLITIGFFFRVVLYIFRAHWYSSDFYRINSSLSNTEITTRFSFINSCPVWA